jgi:hypothetical protein
MIQFDHGSDDCLGLKHFVFRNLKIRTNAARSANYAVVFLVTTTYDAFGTLQKDACLDFCPDYLVHEKWRVVAKSLCDVLSNA